MKTTVYRKFLFAFILTCINIVLPVIAIIAHNNKLLDYAFVCASCTDVMIAIMVA